MPMILGEADVLKELQFLLGVIFSIFAKDTTILFKIK